LGDYIWGIWPVDLNQVHTTVEGCKVPLAWWWDYPQGFCGYRRLYYESKYPFSGSTYATTYYSNERYLCTYQSDYTGEKLSVNWTLSLPYTITWQTTTNINDSYSFSGLDSGTYKISASKTNYTACSQNPVERSVSGNIAVNFCLSNKTNQLPIAIASAYPNPAYVGQNISFSSAGSYDPDGTIVSYLWNFGDGATSNEPNPVHAYTEPGNYTATLTVTDDKGASNTTSFLIAVRCSSPFLSRDPTIKSNYEDSPLKALQDLIGKNVYIDSDITVYAEKDKCISSVSASLTTINITPQSKFEHEMQKIDSGKYFLNFKGYSVGVTISFIIQILTKGLMDLPWFIETYPDIYLVNVTIRDVYNILYPFHQNIRLDTAWDELKSYFGFGGEIGGVVAASPVDILVIDPEGRQIGAEYKNGVFIGEFNDFNESGIYSGKNSHPQIVLFIPETEGFYQIKVYGIENGTYNLTRFFIDNRTFYFEELSNLPVLQNESISHMLLIDRTPPEIAINEPLNNSFINNKKVSISWNATDNIGISYFEVILDNTPYANASETHITLFNLSEGFHSAEVKVYDLANNSASDFVSFTIDTIPPSISEFSVAPSAGFTCTIYNFSAKVTDEISGVKEVIAKLISSNGSMVLNLSKVNNTYSGSISNLQTNSYFIEILAEDNAGNIAIERTPFNVTSYVLDWLPPVNLTKSFNLGSTIPIKFTLHDKLNRSFVFDNSVRVEVFNPNNILIFNTTYGAGDDFVRINSTEHYITNLHTNKTWISGNYTIKVNFANNKCNIFKKIITLENKGGKEK